MYIAPRHMGWIAGLLIVGLSACGVGKTLKKQKEIITVVCNNEVIMSGPRGLIQKNDMKIQLYTAEDFNFVKQIYVMKPGDNCKVE